MQRNTVVAVEEILDRCITAVRRGEAVGQCLELFPAHRGELEPLLQLAGNLSAARTVMAPVEFRQTAVTRMNNLIAARPRPAMPVAQPNPLRDSSIRLKLPLRFSVTALLALALLVGGGVGYASADALPGDVLYPVKTAIETIQLTVSRDAAQAAALRLDFASRRLDEAAAMVVEGRLEQMPALLLNYAVHVDTVSDLIEQPDRLAPALQTALADHLMAVMAEHEARLAALTGQVSPSALEAVDLALAVSRTGRERARQVLGDLPQPPVRPTETLPSVDRPSPTATLTQTASRTPTGTSTPTLSMTATPTASATSTATASPTAPRLQPTRAPLPTPTFLPKPPKSTVTPLPTPTWLPSPWPTAWPEGWPTAWPEGWPTAWPESWPTAWPEGWPTAWPEGWPTAWPTVLPPELPAAWPTAWPEDVPAAWPSDLPVAWPTPGFP
ncbi:MAG: DUF5667 domain-containing protein [Chloroflexota bacterium]